MSRKTTILLAILLGITTLLFVVFLRNKSDQPPPSDLTQQPSVTAETKLLVEPSVLNLTGGTTGVLQVTLDSAVNEITGVQLEMQYDPAILSNVSLEPGPFLPEPLILKNTVNAETGRITFIMGITPQQNPIKGKGTVATLKFTKKATNSSVTNITILPESEVTAQGINTTVLKEAMGAQITF